MDVKLKIKAYSPDKCFICDKKHVDPMILLCYHYFCAGCLPSFFQGENIKCPVCKLVTEVWTIKRKEGKDGMASRFGPDKIQKEDKMPKKDQFVFKPKGDSDSEKSVDDFACERCKTSTKIEFYCYDCCRWICQQCLYFHSKIPSFQKHRTHTVQERIDELSEIIERSMRSLHEKIQAYQLIKKRQVQLQTSNIQDLLNISLKNSDIIRQDCHSELDQYFDIVNEKIREHARQLRAYLSRSIKKLDHDTEVMRHKLAEAEYMRQDKQFFKQPGRGFPLRFKGYVDTVRVPDYAANDIRLATPIRDRQWSVRGAVSLLAMNKQGITSEYEIATEKFLEYRNLLGKLSL